MGTEFRESQKFSQWWLWLIMLAVALSTLLAPFESITDLEEKFQNVGFLIVFSIELLVILLFWFMKLNTKINRDGIFIHFFPFAKKTILWQEVQSAEVINYGFVGGWGIRFFTKYGTVYNVKGKKGLALTLKNGKKMLVGTQKEEELLTFLTENIPAKPKN